MPHQDPIETPHQSAGHHRPHIPEERGYHFAKNSSAPTAQSLLDRIRSMFGWLSHQTAHKDPPVSAAQTASNRLLSLYSAPNLVQRAKKTLAKLDASKHALLQEFGPRAQAFVDRYIDPVLFPIKSFLKAREDGTVAEIARVAVGHVGIIGIAHDPTRLQRKIQDTIHKKTHDVILEDIAFILSYPSEVVADVSIPTDKRSSLLRQIETALQPVLLELESLLSRKPPSPEFSALFLWRSDLDLERQQLHDQAMHIIDEEVHRNAPYWKSFEMELEGGVDPFLEELEIFSSGGLTWPLSIFELEETSIRFREAVEKELVSLRNDQVIAFYDRLKAHILQMIESEESEGHEEAIQRILEQLHAIERLLGNEE